MYDAIGLNAREHRHSRAQGVEVFHEASRASGTGELHDRVVVEAAEIDGAQPTVIRDRSGIIEDRKPLALRYPGAGELMNLPAWTCSSSIKRMYQDT